MNGFDASLVPLFTAIAGLTAAVIAGIAAYVVARVNAGASRQLAIDASHRRYRLQIAGRTTREARTVLRGLQEAQIAAYLGDATAWTAACLKVQFQWPVEDLRQPNDDSFMRAIIAARRRRAEVINILGRLQVEVTAKDGRVEAKRMNQSVIVAAIDYFTEVAAVLEMAAEAYVFDLHDIRRSTIRALKSLPAQNLEERIAGMGRHPWTAIELG